jgi:small-conductance mechanosensitive channel
MEAVAAAASLITLIELSAKITSTCVQYSRAVKDAANDISRLYKEVKSLQEVLEQARQLLNGPHAAKLPASQAMNDAIKDSKTELHNLDQRLAPSKSRKFMSLVDSRALKWPFKAAEVDKFLTQLGRCKQSISLALQVDQT